MPPWIDLQEAQKSAEQLRDESTAELDTGGILMAQKLRPYQQRAKDKIHAEWESGHRRTLLVLPTGTGKTIVFASVAADQVRAGDRELILAHRGELLEQSADKLQRSTGLVSAVEKAESTCLNSWFRVVVGSVQTLQRPARLERFPRNISAPSSSTKPTTPLPTATAASWTTSRVQRCWV